MASLGRAAVAYGRACSAGVARACGEQARLLLWGTGIQADPRGAVALFTKGCSKGDGGACAVLGDPAHHGARGAEGLAEGRHVRPHGHR